MEGGNLARGAGEGEDCNCSVLTVTTHSSMDSVAQMKSQSMSPELMLLGHLAQRSLLCAAESSRSSSYSVSGVD